MTRHVTALVLAGLLTACGGQATARSGATTPSPTLQTIIATPAATPTPTPTPLLPTPAPSRQPTVPPAPRPTAPPVMMAAISAMNFMFSPSMLTVRAGTRVTFTNRDLATHTFTANGGRFSSGNVTSGQSYTFTFTAAGGYPYHCQIHASMTGTINVTG